MNLFLSLWVVFRLTYYLTKEIFPSVFSALAFGFCPYQFVRIWQHLGLTYNQWIPLVLLAAILLRENKGKKYALFMVFSIFLLFSFDYSVSYLGITSLCIFALYLLFYHWRIKLFRKRELLFQDLSYLKKLFLLVSAGCLLILNQILPFIIDVLKFSSTAIGSAHNSYRRPFEDLFFQSAKPLSYILPAATHPVFGKFSEQFIGSPLYGDSLTEHTLYLGWVPLILAFIAVRQWRRLRAKQDHLRVERSRDDFFIGFFIFLAAAAWLFSQPPWWQLGQLKIYMPSFVMYKILPMFRAYCRFGIVLMLAVAVLAGFGLKVILENAKSRIRRTALGCLCSGLLLFEFWNYPPFKVIDVSKAPQVYYWLQAQSPSTVIAEYPLDADTPNEMYKFFQSKHQKRMINGTVPGTSANRFAQTITKLSDERTCATLKWMGVKYVLLHSEDYLGSCLIEDKEEIEAIPKNKGLRLVMSFPAQECPQRDIFCTQKSGPIEVYEIVAEPIEPREVEK